MDKEIRAMEQVANALTELDADIVARVLRWAADRHGVTEKLGWAEEQSPARLAGRSQQTGHPVT